VVFSLDSGSGGSWFHVDVVVRTGRVSGDELVAAVLPALVEIADAPAEVTAPSATASYDAEPPEGSAGVGLWVRSDSIGGAVDAAVRVVAGAAADLDEHLALWDVRALPVEAVLREPPPGAIATLEADGPELV
jgi:hypothetical protein